MNEPNLSEMDFKELPFGLTSCLTNNIKKRNEKILTNQALKNEKFL